MVIHKEIVDAYLEVQSLTQFQNEWYFSCPSVTSEQVKNAFQEPEYDEEMRNKVKQVSEAIENTVTGFTPTNVEIWNTLVPNWEKAIDDIDVDLIIGFPKPHDATVEHDPDGKRHVILDMICWSEYLGKCDIATVVQDILTHELFHVMIGYSIDSIDDDLTSDDYLTKLDAISFHEAFAHLVSFMAKEIEEVDWHTATWEDVKAKSAKRMKDALGESDKEMQEKNAYEALCGNYYDKYACMIGMLYLVDVWEKDGIQGLKREFDLGYHGFAAKTIAQ